MYIVHNDNILSSLKVVTIPDSPATVPTQHISIINNNNRAGCHNDTIIRFNPT